MKRQGKRIVLTEAGKKFKLYADKMIKLNEEAKMAVVFDKYDSEQIIYKRFLNSLT